MAETISVVEISNFLRRVVIRAGRAFSGVGIIVSSRPAELPVFPLRPMASVIIECLDAAETLAKISSITSDFHDGFHVVDTELQINRICQYFSPPIALVKMNPDLLVGGRYMAAIFGSTIEFVHYTAIVGVDGRLAVFQHGEEVHSEMVL